MQTQPPQETFYDEDEIDLLELWEILIDKWLWIVFLPAIAAVGSYFVVKEITPIYRSEVIMIAADDSTSRSALSSLSAQFGGLADLAGVNLGGSNQSEAFVMLNSRTLAEEFIQENNLLQVLFEQLWDTAAQKWQVEEKKQIPTMNDAYNYLTKEILLINQDKKTGVITLAIEWKDRDLAAKWANEIVKRANQIMRSRAIREAQGNIDYLNKELSKTSVVEIQQAIYRLIEANYKTTSIANSREEYVFKVIDPAVAADEDQPVRPKRLLIIALATLATGFITVLGIFMHHGLQNMRQRRAQRVEPT